MARTQPAVSREFTRGHGVFLQTALSRADASFVTSSNTAEVTRRAIIIALAGYLVFHLMFLPRGRDADASFVTMSNTAEVTWRAIHRFLAVDPRGSGTRWDWWEYKGCQRS
jgi:hypothetical protein